MATPRKFEKRPAPTKVDIKNKGTKQRPADAALPPAQSTASTDLTAEHSRFVIVYIGASAEGWEDSIKTKTQVENA
ncbi:MAG: hypothetical protein KF722_12650 [Nitrospira sp.]|nr:hypothetical protein [Nitrospira sp.]